MVNVSSSMGPGILILVALLALALGAVLGWLFARRPMAQLSADLAAATAWADQARALRASLDLVAQERDEARVQLSGDRARMEERAKAFAERVAELESAREALVARFAEVGQQALENAQRQFLVRADQRFAQAGDTQEAKIKALLDPVADTLKRYDAKLAAVEKERIDSYAGLREAVEQVRHGQAQVRDETARLVNALRTAPKARGRWGEQQLRNVLEMAGLSPHADFQTEVVVAGEEGWLRPDVIVRLPGGRQLVIDAKCSLNAYLDASDAIDEEGRRRAMAAHAAAIRQHAGQLGSKSYWAHFGDAADYVVMFIPGEHFLSAALEEDPELWNWAFERRVLLATPTNLIAIARTVAAVWRQERLAEQAAAIAALGKDLHTRLATMGTHVGRLGKALGQATGYYNQFVGSLESQVLTQARRFEALDVAGGNKTIEDLAPIEALPRPLAKLAAEPVPEDTARADGHTD